MGLSTDTDTSPSPEFLAVFRTHADATGAMPFARFMALALYDPQVGYYTAERKRVGYSGADFFTASTSGPVFGELVAAACAKRLRDAGRDPAQHTFIEIGAETEGGVLAGVAHPFRATRTLRLGVPLELSGDCIVFSNELFDAQPCMRTAFRHGGWEEVHVQEKAGRLTEIERPAPAGLEPVEMPEGYCFDRSVAATDLARALAAQPWRGLFVAFDYGKTLHQLVTETPAGTVRGYFRHTQTNDVLARPGQQDLTCHVCWDWLEQALRDQGFTTPALDTQESFLIRHAGDYIAAASAADAARLSPRKLALLQLLHPSHLGQKFQVLHALR